MSHSTEHNSRPEQSATLFIAASETDSNLYYATRFIAPDPFIYLEVKGERLMVMSDLEVDRARNQATVDRVLSYSELERRAKSQGVKDPGTIDVIHLVLQDAGLKDILVPPTFPFLHASRLQEMGFTPGCPVRLVAKAAFGGPMAFQVRGSLVALRRSDAACVEV